MDASRFTKLPPISTILTKPKGFNASKQVGKPDKLKLINLEFNRCKKFASTPAKPILSRRDILANAIERRWKLEELNKDQL